MHKPAGWTPLEAMEALRARTPALAEEPMVYAGRLDPMAEGLLLVLTGPDRHALPAHLGHDKAYVATFLFGVGSDTHDALGRLTLAAAPPGVGSCADAVAALVGAHLLPLPAWSAYRVHGRPLHWWASAGRLGEIERPVRAMEVRGVEAVTGAETRVAEILDDVQRRIARVAGTFRQAEAAEDWAALATRDPPLVAVQATLTVGSGTYIRALAHDLGERFGCGGLLLRLVRTRIGAWRGEGT